MKTEPDYVKVGDYCFPGLTAKPYLDRGLDKYGLLRLRYLKEHRPIVWAEYVMVGKLYAYLLKVEDTAQDLLNNMMPVMEKGTGATKELKARDFCTVHIFWVDDCKIFFFAQKTNHSSTIHQVY